MVKEGREDEERWRDGVEWERTRKSEKSKFDELSWFDRSCGGVVVVEERREEKEKRVEATGYIKKRRAFKSRDLRTFY